MVFANGQYLDGPEHDRKTIIPAKKSRRLARSGVQLVDLFEKSIVRLQAALISKHAYEDVGGHARVPAHLHGPRSFIRDTTS